ENVNCNISGDSNFNFQSREELIIQIPVKNINRPYPGALVTLFDEKGNKLQTGYTDNNGIFTEKVDVFDGTSIYASVQAVGIPNIKKLVYKNSNSSEIRNCVLNKNNLRILTVGEYDSNGVLFSTETNLTVSPQLIEDVNYALPERGDLRNTHPEYLLNGVSTNIKLDQEADVWVTFLHEGAGYKNSFGYFTYTDGNIPTDVNQIEKIAVFPNASFKGSGGNLSSGDRVRIGRFPAGTIIGFWIIANGWNGTGIDESRNTYFSIPSLNKENDVDLKRHLAMLYYQNEQKIILGFEDLFRESTSCDHDFNDIIFTVEANPVESINLAGIVNVPEKMDSDNDGVADNNDPFPYDSQKTFVRYFPGIDTKSIIAFEDLFPFKGDYDFNDLVVSIQIKEILNPEKKIKEFEAEFEILAVGASNQNGLMILIETDESNLEQSERYINGSYIDSGLELGHENELVIKVIDNSRNHIQFPAGFNFANTIEGTPRVVGDKFKIHVIFKNPINDVSPFNPFLFNYKNRGLEVHLMDYRPSLFFNTSYFSTGDDKSNPETNVFYKDKNGYPWAILVGQDFENPLEKVSIVSAYNNFKSWAESGGINYKNWVQNKNIDKIYR
ncbi:MAG: LruC domain-containing protein, partial [Leptospiraceae bacterium]|nr:LruC domain-containing protein [Leptospiraceae bacterium]